MTYVLTGIVLLSLLISVIYGIIIITRYKNIKPIFKVTLIAIITLFIARLYFLIFNLSDGNEEKFSIGVLGQVAGYLFLSTCNKSYLPFESNENKFSIKALLINLIPIVCYSMVIINNTDLSSIVCTILYCLSLCFALYFAFKNLLLSDFNEEYKKLKKYNICIMGLLIMSCIENVLILINNGTLYLVLCTILTIITSIFVLLILPMLKKGIGTEYDS